MNYRPGRGAAFGSGAEGPFAQVPPVDPAEARGREDRV